MIFKVGVRRSMVRNRESKDLTPILGMLCLASRARSCKRIR